MQMGPHTVLTAEYSGNVSTRGSGEVIGLFALDRSTFESMARVFVQAAAPFTSLELPELETNLVMQPFGA
jgi:hypothetical protein